VIQRGILEMSKLYRVFIMGSIQPQTSASVLTVSSAPNDKEWGLLLGELRMCSNFFPCDAGTIYFWKLHTKPIF
jgi:hypothetical protein